MSSASEWAGDSKRRAYRMGVVVAVLASFGTVWTTIVRDDGNGIGFLLLVVAAAVSAFSAEFQPAGLARAMIGVAVMQVLLGIAIATAPSTASADGSSRALLFSAGFAAVWLISAAFFRAAAKADHQISG